MTKEIEEYYKRAYSEEKVSKHEWVAGTANPELVNLVYTNKIKPNSKILEVGCGIGSESVFLAVRGMNVTALDISESAISKAKELANVYDTKVNWKVGNILTDDDLDEKFDVITDQGCFHHLSDEERVRYEEKIVKLLKPKGMFILRCFSDKIPGGPQPRRISSDELIDTFHKDFKLDRLEHVLSFSTQKRKFPLGWFSLWCKR